MNRQIGLLAFLLMLPVAAIATAWTAASALASTSFASGTYGYDVSYPDSSAPDTTFQGLSFTFGIVGVTGGKAFNQNSKLGTEYGWVTSNRLTPSLYMNLNYPVGTTAPNGMTGPAGNCAKSDKSCQAYNYGYNAASKAFDYANSKNAAATSWWLDIETANSWSAKPSLNYRVVEGARDFLQQQGIAVGIYSNSSMWNSIMGANKPGMPVWYAAPRDISPTSTTGGMPAYCSAKYAFTGGTVAVVQSYNSSFAHDLDYACP